MFNANKSTKLLDKKFILSDNAMGRNDPCQRKKNLYLKYSLMILIELAEAYECQGYPIQYIARKYDFQQEELPEVVNQLESIGLITRDHINPEWLFLKEEPKGQWIFEIVTLLKSIYLH